MTDFDIAKVQELEHRTEDASAPEVFFTPVITPESLIAAYHAWELGWKVRSPSKSIPENPKNPII